MRVTRVLALVLSGLFLQAGCPQSDFDEADAAVRSYCEAVIVAYRTSDPTAVQPVTTDKELRKLVVLIDLKTSTRVVLENVLEDLQVTGVDKPGPSLMTVRTTERWRYYDRPLEVGKEPGTEFVVEMDLSYSFVKSEGLWLMDQARTERHEYLQPEGYGHDQHQEHGSIEGDQ